MRSRRVRLPRGVALFQVCTAERWFVLVAAELDAVRARLARDAASIRASRGEAVIVITDAQLEKALGREA